MKGLIINRDFGLLWMGQSVSSIGSMAYHVAMMFWIKNATGDTRVLGLLLMTSAIPAVLLSPFAGTVADLFSRKKIVVICDVVNGTAMLGLTIFFYVNPGNTEAVLAGLFVIAVILGVSMAFFQPAVRAAVPDMVPVEKVNQAVSMQQFTIQIASLTGTLLGGVIYQAAGAIKLFLFNGLSFLFSAASEATIRIPQTFPEKAKGIKNILAQFMRETGAAFRYVWSNKGMRALFFGMGVINFFVFPIIAMMPFYIEDSLGKSPVWYGILIGSNALGSLLGTVLVGKFKPNGRHRALFMLIALPWMGVNLWIFGTVLIAEIVVFFFFLNGILNGSFNITTTVLLQLTTKSEIRGRVFGLLVTIASAVSPIAFGLSGFAANALDNNIALLFQICGLVLVGLAVLLGLSSAYRKFIGTVVDFGSSDTTDQASQDGDSTATGPVTPA